MAMMTTFKFTRYIEYEIRLKKVIQEVHLPSPLPRLDKNGSMKNIAMEISDGHHTFAKEPYDFPI